MFEPKLWIKPTNTKWLVKEISQYLDWVIKKQVFEGKINIYLTNANYVLDSKARGKEGNFSGSLNKIETPALSFPLGEIFKEISKKGKEIALCDWLQYLTFFLYCYVDWQKDREFNIESNNDFADKMIYEYIDFKKINFESEDRRKKENRKRAKNKGKKKEKKRRQNKRI
ncbi:hypothetical protein [Lactococcus lactis]|uniref:hypothetical protein n=1 Tax=Lactococcus lactis TaxID=1358 RepID=UPI0011BB6F96|nr:hypothetical protein [Lactococcus lactis]MDG4964571.1 hypothetical protein [Lactococcus lactis]QEA60269.1 hypothetical protein FGL73_01710 [Lactococcus lactis]